MDTSDFSQAMLLRPEAAAEFLAIQRRTLEGWRYRGDGPLYVRLSSRAIRYRVRDLEAFAEARLCSSTADTGEPSAA